MLELHTIGYARFSEEAFLEILKNFTINAVFDVRSQPYSRYKPGFNYRNLKTTLARHGINYIFLGDCCGGRSKDPYDHMDRQAGYKLIAANPRFKEGIRRIRSCIPRFRVTLLCAESDPLFCHRNILVCRALKAPGLEIKHILFPGTIEYNHQTEDRLLQVFGLKQNELFTSREELLAEAYDRQGAKLAFSRHGKRDSYPPDSNLF